MSANIREDFLRESPPIFGYGEEAWQEATPAETDDIEHHHDETGKKYILVLNKQTVRLGSQPFDIAISEAIERSKEILSLQENWDDEGSPPYDESMVLPKNWTGE